MPASAASALAHELAASPRAPSSSRIGRMLCAHRLSAAPAQPNQRLSRRLASAMALRSTRASPTLRSRPSAKKRAGSWQVAHERLPSRRGACRRTAAGRARWRPALPETRLLGSGVERRRPGPVRQDRRALGVAEGGGRRARDRAPTSAAAAGDRQRGKAGDGGERPSWLQGHLLRQARAPVALEQVERQPPGAGHVQHQSGEAEPARARLAYRSADSSCRGRAPASARRGRSSRTASAPGARQAITSAAKNWPTLSSPGSQR